MVKSKSVMLKSFVILIRRESGSAQMRCTLYIRLMNLQFVVCGVWMVHGIVIFYAYKISWNKELFTTFSYSVSFSCLIFLGAFHTSRLLSDACIFVRFNSLRGLHTSFIMKATISLVFPRLSAFATLRNTRSLLGREEPVTSFVLFVYQVVFCMFFIKNQLPVPETRSPQVLRQDAFPLPPGPRDACLTRAWNYNLLM